METRSQRSPHAMTATATHDTKRGEDARARIAAVSELAEDWSGAVHRWIQMNARLIAPDKHRSPSRAHEYMLYQALIGAWPDDGGTREFAKRIKAYLIKAAREGEQETSWLSPNEDYENGLTQFVERLLDHNESESFLDDFSAFARRTSLLGALNGLSQLVLKTTIPGVPDFYQGTELCDLSLVDPDNRQSVDFELRARLLSTIGDHLNSRVANWSYGQAKLALTHRLLNLRAEFPGLFLEGRYEPIEVVGTHRKHVIAFARVLVRDAIVIAVGRHFVPFTEGGRHWPRRDAIEAAIQLRQFRIEYDLLHLAAVAQDCSLPVLVAFGEAPVAVLRARTL